MNIKARLLNATIPVFAGSLALYLEVHVGNRPLPFVFTYPAVFFSAVFGGLLPGLICTAFCAAVGWMLTIPVRQGDLSSYLGLFAFLLVGVSISFLVEARRRAHERLRLESERLDFALRGAEMGFWEVDFSTGKAWNSARTDELLGVENAGSMRPADEILMNVHPEDKLAIRQALDAIRQRSQPFDLIHRVILPNQELRWIHSKGGVLYDSEGRPARLFGVVFDVTSRIQQEHQLNDTLKQLQEERTVRERFVSTLSHDLRNPLSVIASCSELILRQKADPLVKRLTTQISRNSRRADQMISNLLDANRISSGESLLLSLENLSLRKMISVLIEDLAAVHGNRFVLDMESELSGYWNADAIRRIVENLANNAVKYGASDRPITLRVAQQGADALLSVQNFGKTLSRAEQASLFRPYQRTVDAQFSGKKGWGLGLTLVRGLAEAHGGSVWVESHVGRGTTFYVRLPLDARPYQTGEQTDRENTDLQRPA